jgi:membrane protein
MSKGWAGARGRRAKRPKDMPKPGWRDILLRTYAGMTNDHVSIVAAGVAFYGLLALFPAIVAIISIAGLVMDPSAVQAQLAELSAVLPDTAASIITDQASEVASNAGTGLGLAAAFGIAFALFSAARGVKSLMEGINIAYDEVEKRGFLMFNLVAYLLTVVLVLGLILALASTIVVPAVLAWVGLGGFVEGLIRWLRWPLLAIVTILGLAIVYRYGPSRENARWRWVSPGAVAATALWVVGSLAFSIYVRNFGSYNEVYGTLGGVIVLLLWLWVSAFIVLMGAELNAELEHQTIVDTTTGKPLPRGERGAVKADTVGPVP